MLTLPEAHQDKGNAAAGLTISGPSLLGSTGAGRSTVTPSTARGSLSAVTGPGSFAALSINAGSAPRAAAEAILGAAESAAPAAKEQVRPAAEATVKLAAALEGLLPENVGGLDGGAESVLSAAQVASNAVNKVEELSREGGPAAASGEDAEAAGAILAEAGQAVERLARVGVGS